MVWNEIEIVGSFSHIYDIDFKEAVDLIGAGKLTIEPLITKKVSLANAVSGGFEELLNNSKDHIKILISPHLA